MNTTKRTVRLIAPATASMPAIVQVAVGKKVDAYVVSYVPADFGRGFRVQKTDNDGTTDGDYHVNIDGNVSLCDCIGHAAHGHCKHAEALRALVNSSKL